VLGAGRKSDCHLYKSTDAPENDSRFARSALFLVGRCSGSVDAYADLAVFQEAGSG
jgi:hypothetical protein